MAFKMLVVYIFGGFFNSYREMLFPAAGVLASIGEEGESGFGKECGF